MIEDSLINKKEKEKKRVKKKIELHCKYLKFSAPCVGYSKQQDG